MTREDMATLLGSAWSRVWAIHARASGKTETNPALAEVAGAALADISVVRAFLADNPAWVSPAAALDVCRRAIHEINSGRENCGVWGTECPLQDAGKSYHPLTEALTAIDAALAAAPADLVEIVREWQASDSEPDWINIVGAEYEAARLRSRAADRALAAYPLPPKEPTR